MGKNFVEPPLEGLWWADDMADFVGGIKDKLKWRMMIPTADWVSEDMLAEAVAEAANKLGEAPKSLRLDHLDEGRSVQIMHVGPYEKEAATLARRTGAGQSRVLAPLTSSLHLGCPNCSFVVVVMPCSPPPQPEPRRTG